MQENKQEKSFIKQNILSYLKKIGVTPYECYKKTGITRGVLTQNNGITEENILKFLAYYSEVDVTWLITGRDISHIPKQNEISGEKKNEVNESITLYNCPECFNKQNEIKMWREKYYTQCEELNEVNRKYRELLEGKIELKKEMSSASDQKVG